MIKYCKPKRDKVIKNISSDFDLEQKAIIDDYLKSQYEWAEIVTQFNIINMN